jgi:O-antigen/teichoic acid export membrane protein
MAFIDVRNLAAWRPWSRLQARAQAWLATDEGLAQRIAGTAFVIRVAGAGLIFLSQVLLARWLGAFEYGTYVYAWTWLLLIGDIIHLGLPLTAQRYIPEYTQRNAFELLRGYLIGSRRAVFATATLVATLAAAAVYSLRPSLDTHLVLPLYFACAVLPFYTLSNLFDGVARSYDAITIALLPQFVLRPIVLIAVMAAAYSSGLVTDAATAMLAFGFATWSTSLFQFVMLERRVRQSVPPGPRRYDFKGWIATSLPIIAVGAFFTLLTYTDVLVLQLFRPSDEVAHYFAATKTLSLVAFIYFSVSASVAHRFAAYHVAGDHDGLMAFARSTVHWTFWPSLVATLLILALGKPILWLFGPNFSSSYPLMFILAVGLLARAAVGPAERLLNMMDEQRMCALIYACAFGVNVAGAFLLAPRFGSAGAAVAITLAIMVESALLFVVAKRRLGIHLFIWQPGARAAS